MNTEVQFHIAKDRTAELLRDSRRRSEMTHPRTTASSSHPGPDTHLRLAVTADAAALRRLAELEGRPAPEGDVLVAEVEGRVLAALPLSGDPVLADPFAQTSRLAAELDAARLHLLGEPPRSRRWSPRRLWRRLALSAEPAAPRRAGAPAVPGSESLMIR